MRSSMSICKAESNVAKVNKGGRPPVVLNQKHIHQLEALTAFGHTQKEICDYMDLKDRTFRDIKNRDSEVSAAYRVGRFEAKNLVTSRLMEYIQDKTNPAVSLSAIKFMLERQFGWEAKQQIETKDMTPRQPPTIIVNFSDNSDDFQRTKLKDDCKN